MAIPILRAKLAAGVFACLVLQGCGEDKSGETLTLPTSVIGQTEFTLYKSPDCGCCGVWAEHMEAAGHTFNVNHPDDLNGVKDSLGIDNELRSCHTTVTDEGYIFEGHIPEKYVQQFLDNPPQNALGLAVPGMPLGSPGMEMGDRFSPYSIILINKDGSQEVYAEIKSAEDQKG